MTQVHWWRRRRPALCVEGLNLTGGGETHWRWHWCLQKALVAGQKVLLSSFYPFHHLPPLPQHIHLHSFALLHLRHRFHIFSIALASFPNHRSPCLSRAVSSLVTFATAASVSVAVAPCHHPSAPLFIIDDRFLLTSAASIGCL